MSLEKIMSTPWGILIVTAIAFGGGFSGSFATGDVDARQLAQNMQPHLTEFIDSRIELAQSDRLELETTQQELQKSNLDGQMASLRAAIAESESRITKQISGVAMDTDKKIEGAVLNTSDRVYRYEILDWQETYAEWDAGGRVGPMPKLPYLAQPPFGR